VQALTGSFFRRVDAHHHRRRYRRHPGHHHRLDRPGNEKLNIIMFPAHPPTLSPARRDDPAAAACTPPARCHSVLLSPCCIYASLLILPSSFFGFRISFIAFLRPVAVIGDEMVAGSSPDRSVHPTSVCGRVGLCGNRGQRDIKCTGRFSYFEYSVPCSSMHSYDHYAARYAFRPLTGILPDSAGCHDPCFADDSPF
jgi:hypothetical protein